MGLEGRAERWASYRAKAARIPFSFETGHDCAQGLVAGWVSQETGQDAAALWRGRYRTALGCQRMLRREGGLVAVMQKSMDVLGLQRTDAPCLGDIGAVVVVTPYGEEPVGAVRGVIGWTTLTGRGIRASRRAELIVAWRLP